MTQVAVHSMLEMFDCPQERLNDVEFAREVVREAAVAAGATVLAEVAHRFEPQGVTAIAVLAESHLSVHTWPEYGYAAADVFTCGTTTDPEAACRLLADRFGAARHELKTLSRGPDVGDSPPAYSPITER
ncbi:MAG: adenosylmethionine decarboxylase [Myxococcota bacterium]